MRSCFHNLFLLFLAIFLLSSCQSITRNSADMAVPGSTVIFSFDDGPNASFDSTARLLDVLKKYEINSLFVLLGENAEAYPELVRRIHNEGHYIVNHGYAGKWARGMGEGEFLNNLTRGEIAISSALGHELSPKLYRPHGGFYSSRHEKIYSEAGYTMVPGSVRVYDAVKSGKDQDKVIRRVIKKIEKENGGIVLLHDSRDSHFQMNKKLEKKPDSAFNRSWIPEATEGIIIALISKGYNLYGTAEYVEEMIK